MATLRGRLARRALICAGISLVVTVPAAATAAPDSAVVTVGSRYLPGDSTSPLAVIVLEGGGLTYTNFDLVEDHSVTSDDLDALGNHLFDSPRLRTRQSASVVGVAALTEGKYGFHCSIHEGMRGTIQVIGS